MARLGAATDELYEAYARVLHRYWATNLPDCLALAAETRALLASDPAWPHVYALLVLLEGKTTDAARETRSIARVRVEAARDPSGMRLLDAYDAVARGEIELANVTFTELYRSDAEELHAGSEAMVTAVALQRADEATATARQLHAAHPELVFGMDLADLLRRAGRDTAATEVIRAWTAVAPNNVVARAELVRILAATDRLEEARAHATELLAGHGDDKDALPDLFEAAVQVDAFSAAHRIADGMLLGSALSRARGRYRVAIVAVFEGRFAAAYDSVRRAIDENRPFGFQSELLQCLELARSLAPLVADRAAERRYTAELVDTFATWMGDTVTAAATRFELALLDRTTSVPSIDEHLAELTDEAMRDVARRRMLRAAAMADCGSPHKALAAGLSAGEENTASLLAFGLCAQKLEEYELARRSFERASRLWSCLISNQSSPYHAVLARFHLAGVLADIGDHEASRAWYEAFLRCWSDADRPIREVTVARRMLQRT